MKQEKVASSSHVPLLFSSVDAPDPVDIAGHVVKEKELPLDADTIAPASKKIRKVEEANKGQDGQMKTKDIASSRTAFSFSTRPRSELAADDLLAAMRNMP